MSRSLDTRLSRTQGATLQDNRGGMPTTFTPTAPKTATQPITAFQRSLYEDRMLRAQKSAQHAQEQARQNAQKGLAPTGYGGASRGDSLGQNVTPADFVQGRYDARKGLGSGPAIRTGRATRAESLGTNVTPSDMMLASSGQQAAQPGAMTPFMQSTYKSRAMKHQKAADGASLAAERHKEALSGNGPPPPTSGGVSRAILPAGADTSNFKPGEVTTLPDGRLQAERRHAIPTQPSDYERRDLIRRQEAYARRQRTAADDQRMAVGLPTLQERGFADDANARANTTTEADVGFKGAQTAAEQAKAADTQARTQLALPAEVQGIYSEVEKRKAEARGLDVQTRGQEEIIPHQTAAAKAAAERAGLENKAEEAKLPHVGPRAEAEVEGVRAGVDAMEAYRRKMEEQQRRIQFLEAQLNKKVGGGLPPNGDEDGGGNEPPPAQQTVATPEIQQQGSQPQYNEGDTASNSKGERIKYVNGEWVPA